MLFGGLFRPLLDLAAEVVVLRVHALLGHAAGGIPWKGILSLATDAVMGLAAGPAMPFLRDPWAVGALSPFPEDGSGLFTGTAIFRRPRLRDTTDGTARPDVGALGPRAVQCELQ